MCGQTKSRFGIDVQSAYDATRGERIEAALADQPFNPSPDDVGMAASLATPANETWPTDPKAPAPERDGTDLEAAEMGMSPIAGRETGANISEGARDGYIKEMHRMIDTGMRTPGMAAVVVTVKLVPGVGLSWGWSGNLSRDQLTNWLIEKQLEEMFGGAGAVLELGGTN